MAQIADIRRNMVDTQLRTYDVTSKRLLDAIEMVGREHFVPEALRGLAYGDQPVEVAAENQETRVLLTPMVLARMIQAAEIEPGDDVLDVAGGSGYGAAVMMAMGAKVTMLEAGPAMAKLAISALAHADLTEIEVKSGGLAKGLPKAGPFDLILINGAIEIEPVVLLNQLRDGGKLIAIIGSGRSGRVTVFQKSGETIGKRSIFDASAPVLAEFRQNASFQF
jgi:protein-L-isoaspartate(D-aspartate) O-methyltransferase